MTGRVPPQNIEAEMAVLGSMLLGDRNAIERVTEFLDKQDFYREAHGRIFEAMLSLVDKDEPVDIVTLKDELTRRGTLEQTGGYLYLMQLAEYVPTPANIVYYAKIVSEKAVLRRLIETASEIAGMAYGETDEVDTLVDQAERAIFNVARKRKTEGFTPLRPLLSEVFEQIDVAYHDKGVVSGTDTGFYDLNYITSGLKRGDLIIVAARPSMGKCLTARTLVDDPLTGERLTIEEAVRRKMPRIAGVSECGRIRPTAISDWIDSGIKPAFRVTTKTGRFVEVTGHHPFLTVKGWQPLHDLVVGDSIAVPRHLPVFGRDNNLSSDRIRLLAYLIAEGGLTDSCPEWTNTDPELIADFKKIIASEFSELSVRQEKITYIVSRSFVPGTRKNQPNPLTDWLRELGLWGKLAEEKKFPDCIWELSKESLADFLRVLMSCDGTIYPMSGFARIEFAVASEPLARDVQHALVRFGIVAKLWQKNKRCWRVEVTDPESVARYQAEIGWLGEKAQRQFRLERDTARRGNLGHPPKEVWDFVRVAAQQQNLSLTELALSTGEITGRAGYNPHTNRGLPRHRLSAYAEILDNDNLRAIASPELYWDEIISIESLGEQQVYDLTVPDGANFIAQDIIVHNTALTMNIGQNAAGKGSVVATFSLEMSKESLVQRMMCSEAKVNAHKLRTGFLQDEEWSRLSEAVNRLWDAPMFIDDTTDMSSLEMRARCRRLKAEQGSLDLVIVDYLQLMRGSSKNSENRNQEITEIARGLKSLARELDVPVIALSQLSRSVERREDKRPMLSDLRESGAIEAEADLVAFIYRPAYYARKDAVSQEAEEKAEQEGGEYEGEEAEVIIAKQRNGPTGTVKLAFLPKFACFANLAHNTEGPDF
ncbi:replicative DNA helicase [Armatimonas rosea]|uniref:Replicative DNA helicase n=1 Tax=Armatimonas rosea TaxID=685828 RepID=A0A7W9W628_ARMRO|nr:replicative DNA helicase [Armatimonas rosea]MBB6051034.1 replicative DNA helicase [Armatimonas rosea]